MRRGGSIPSGGAPLYLGDFATPMNAVSQRLIGQMVDRVNKKQEQQSKSQKALLEALDFSTIEGLSDQVSQELLDEQNAIEDKWSQQYLENDMVLSDQQRFELRKDMREYERYAAKLKYNVAQAAYVQKELASPNAPEKYDLSSWDNLVKFQQSGGKGDASQILRPAYNVNSMVDDLTADWEDAKLYDTKEEADYKKGIKTVTQTNVEALNDRMTRVLQDPNVQQMLNHPQYGPKLKAGLAKRYEDLKNEQVKEETISPTQQRAYQQLNQTKNLTPQEQELEQKHNLSARGVERKYWGNVVTLNNITTGLLEGDTEAIDDVKGTYSSDLGRIDDVIYTDDEIVLVGTKADKDSPSGKKIVRIMKPNPDNPTEVNLAKQKLASVVRPSIMKNESNLPTDKSSMFFPDWEYDVRGEKVRNTYYRELKEGLKEGKHKKDDVVYYMTQLFDKGAVEARKNKALGIRYRNEQIEWDGHGVYDIETKEGKQKLINDIEKERGYPLTDFNGGEDVGAEVTSTEEVADPLGIL